MKLEAYAKVNLTLEVYGKRADGFHALRSVVQPITLADTVDVVLADELTSDTGFSDDLCLKAARLLVPGRGARISVMKRIPVGGGLGGGSADAAAVLRALNVLCALGHSPEELAALGAAVGSDVPALVLAQAYRRAVLMEGRGEKVSLMPEMSEARFLVLANPGIAVSTAEIYQCCVARQSPAEGFVNDLEAVAVRRHPEIGRTLAALRQVGARDVMMSGSGATCFGFAEDAAEAERMARDLSDVGYSVWIAGELSNK